MLEELPEGYGGDLPKKHIPGLLDIWRDKVPRYSPEETDPIRGYDLKNLGGYSDEELDIIEWWEGETLKLLKLRNLIGGVGAAFLALVLGTIDYSFWYGIKAGAIVGSITTSASLTVVNKLSERVYRHRLDYIQQERDGRK